MTKNELEKIVADGEGSRLEFKETTGQRGEACRTLCAFLNGDGGSVVFGVTRKGRLSGQLVSDETKRDLARSFCDFEPSADIAVEYVSVDDSHQAIVCSVASGARRPYVYDGRPYTRVESTTVKMSQADYDAQLQSRRGYASEWEREVNDKLKLGDLDLVEVCRTARQAVRVGRLAESVDTEDAAMHFCFKHLNLSARFDGSIERAEELEIPAAALREALINAFAHRSYEGLGETVYLAIFDDRVEIRNPGTFPPELDPSRLFALPQERSIPRNPVIANVLYLRKSIETWGRGLGVMARECARAGLRAPTTSVRNGLVVTTLWRPGTNASGNQDRIWIKSGSDAIQIAETSLSELAARLLEIVRLNPLVSRRTLSEELGVSERKVRETMEALRKSGVILRQGAEHGGIWRISRIVRGGHVGNVGNHVGNVGNVGNGIEERVLSLLNADQGISAAKMAKSLSVSVRTVERALMRLRETGVLRRVGGTRGHWELGMRNEELSVVSR